MRPKLQPSPPVKLLMVLQGRCEALEKQLSSLRELPAQLEAAFKRNTPKEAAPTLRARRQSPKST